MRARGGFLLQSKSTRLLLAVTVSVGALMMSGCATPSGSTSPTPTVGESSASPTPTTSPSPTETSVPAPTETPELEAPFNGEVLVVSAEVRSGSLEVTAMVPRVSETNGTCTLELIDGGGTVSIGGTAGNDVTYCGLMSLKVGPGDRDEWDFRVRYESGSTRAESATSTVGSAS